LQLTNKIKESTPYDVVLVCQQS